MLQIQNERLRNSQELLEQERAETRVAERAGELERVNTASRAEQALTAAKDQLHIVTDTMAVGVTRCSRDLRYLWVSRALAHWLGHEPETLVGRSFVDIIGAPTYERIRPHIEQVLEGKRVEYEAEVDYSGPGPRRISAVYEPTRDAAGVVDGWVAIQARIFEPFFTTKPQGKGTGMGLAVVYGILESCGGAIEVESEEGKGTVFTILFPEIAQADQAEATDKKPLPQGHERILFVDDEASVTDIVSKTLERMGYSVITCDSSRQAFNLFSQSPEDFDLVITDQTMPHMTGLTLARKLLSIRPDLPIILCTGYSAAASPEKAKKAGISEFLMKPIVRSKLAETVRKVLDRKRNT